MTNSIALLKIEDSELTISIKNGVTVSGNSYTFLGKYDDVDQDWVNEANIIEINGVKISIDADG